MKKGTIIKSVVTTVTAFIVVVTAGYAASTIDITGLLHGNAGDTFNLDGKLHADSLRVDGNLRANGALKGSAFRARNIRYNGTELGATNVKQALDALTQATSNASLQRMIQEEPTTQTLTGSTWNVTVYDVWGNTLRTTTEIDGTPITVTFTPTSETAGTFSSTPLNLFNPYEQIVNGLHVGTVTGNYTIVGDTILITAVSPTDITVGLTAEMTVVDDNSMIFEEGRVTPNAVLLLTR